MCFARGGGAEYTILSAHALCSLCLCGESSFIPYTHVKFAHNMPAYHFVDGSIASAAFGIM